MKVGLKNDANSHLRGVSNSGRCQATGPGHCQYGRVDLLTYGFWTRGLAPPKSAVFGLGHQAGGMGKSATGLGAS